MSLVRSGNGFGRSFLPKKTSLPQIANRSWARNSIDFFIAAKLEANRLRPSMDASREKLLRRVYLDLVGVPPTVAQIDRFVSNDSPDAYEQRRRPAVVFAGLWRTDGVALVGRSAIRG